MPMKTYATTELLRRSGDVLDDADKMPVTLTKRGKEKYVLMSKEKYDRLLNSRGTTQRSIRVDQASKAELDELNQALDEIIES